jgi:hypothetical protein
VPFAAFSYWVRDDRWEWSDDLYQLHGFGRGEVLPTTELLLAHTHPDDRESVRGRFAAAVTDGEPLVSRHRIVDAGKRQHTVVAFANASRCADGRVNVVEGVMADVTQQLRADIAEATQAAVDGVTENRPAIDEAKGLLMGRYGLSADEAFNILTILSSHTNRKVRSLARQVIELLTSCQMPIEERAVVKDLEVALREAGQHSA